MKIIKHKLNVVDMEKAFFEDTAIIGMACGLPGYRLCWTLNKHFDIELECDPQMTLEAEIIAPTILDFGGDLTERKVTGEPAEAPRAKLPVYQYQFPNSYNRYIIYKLKEDSASLLPEIPRMDYIWLVQTNFFEEDAQHIINELRKIQDISLSQLFDKSQLKNLRNLLV